VLNESSTFAETSVTAMTLFSFVRGVELGVLPTAQFGEAIGRAFQGMVTKIDSDGA
jgi:rhamnogalacturonyl hydrolase YesR